MDGGAALQFQLVVGGVELRDDAVQLFDHARRFALHRFTQLTRLFLHAGRDRKDSAHLLFSLLRMKAERAGFVGEAGAGGMNARQRVLGLRTDNFQLLCDLLGAVGKAGDGALGIGCRFVLRQRQAAEEAVDDIALRIERHGQRTLTVRDLLHGGVETRSLLRDAVLEAGKRDFGGRAQIAELGTARRDFAQQAC